MRNGHSTGCAFVTLAALATGVFSGCKGPPKEKQPLGRLKMLRCSEETNRTFGPGSWSLIVNGESVTGEAFGMNGSRPVPVTKGTLAHIEAVLEENDFAELPCTGFVGTSPLTIIGSGPPDVRAFSLEVRTDKLNKTLSLRYPWPETNEARKAVRIFTFMRSLLDNGTAPAFMDPPHDFRPEMAEWLRASGGAP
jgi:hypothetical protein